MIQIFLSYAREDYATVRQLYNRLRAAGYKPWMDKVDLPKGADFVKAIPKVLRESALFIVCLSQNSVEKRSFIQKEINLALDEWEQKLDDDLYIFPVRLEACKAPDRISKFNWTDLFGDEEEDEWNALLQALCTQAERLGKAPSPASATKLEPREQKPERTKTPPVTKVEAKPDRIVIPKSFPETINGVPLEMILVPAGKFTMGSTEDDDEKPPHEVTLPGFYIGKYQITQAQWKAVMGDKLKPYFKGEDLPMESISWNDAREFCQKLSRMTGKTYRLPSEAEWEYACRAGTTSDYAGKLDEMAWYIQNSDSKTHPVGKKKPNAFGLFDMHGNVWEWYEDLWHENYDGAPTNGAAWTGGGNSKSRVVRGGSWNDFGNGCRSANRSDNDPGDRGNIIGVRVVVGARTL